MIKSVNRIAPPTFIILIIIPASFSVLLTLSTSKSLISLSTNSSRLTLKILDNSFACLISGDVSPNSHFEMVCLVTFNCSASSSCVILFFFLSVKILFPSSTFYFSFQLSFYIFSIFFSTNFGIHLRKFS